MFIKQLPIKKKYFLSLFFLGAIQMWIFFSPLKRQVLYFPNVLFKKKKKNSQSDLHCSCLCSSYNCSAIHYEGTDLVHFV